MNEKKGGIAPEVIESVRRKANIAEVIERFGNVRLKHYGSAPYHYVALSPFRPDKNIGSFHIFEDKGYAKDFSTGELWTPIDVVMQKEGVTFPEAVRLLAAMYNIYIDEQPVPKMKPAKPRPEPAPELPTLLFADMDERTRSYCEGVEESNLVKWMLSLGLNEKRLKWALTAYKVGVAKRGEYKGWTVWWVINELGYLQTGKLMAYMEDGHRDKTTDRYGHEKTTWAHTLWMRAGMYDPTKYQAKTGMFGLQLLNIYPKAQVAVVESEKTAVLMSTFYDPNEVVWMATGGLSSLRNRLQVLIREGRDIVLWPDKDGYEKWKEEAEKLKYNRMRVLTPEQQGWTEEDGPKADVADIMVRRLQTVSETLGQKVAVMLGAPEKGGVMDELIEKLDLVNSEQLTVNNE